MKMEVRKCEKCGKKFATKVNNRKYCSLACKRAVKNERKRSAKKEVKSTKATAAKPVKLTEKIVLDKKASVHTVKKGDVVRFDRSMTAEQVLCFATRLAVLAWANMIKGK